MVNLFEKEHKSLVKVSTKEGDEWQTQTLSAGVFGGKEIIEQGNYLEKIQPKENFASRNNYLRCSDLFSNIDNSCGNDNHHSEREEKKISILKQDFISNFFFSYKINQFSLVKQRTCYLSLYSLLIMKGFLVKIN